MKVIIELYKDVFIESNSHDKDTFFLWMDKGKPEENCIKIGIEDMQLALRKLTAK